MVSARPTKGNGNCAKPFNADGTWAPTDLSQYGFGRWNFPDAGANQDVDEAGGAPSASTSTQNNDSRYMFDSGNVDAGGEGVMAFLNTKASAQQPFFPGGLAREPSRRTRISGEFHGVWI